MTNLFTNLSKNVLCTVNVPKMDRHNIENGPIHSRQLFAVLVMMLWVKLVNFAKLVMQICAESAKSARSIFATFATFASANFVGKASCESTVRYALWSRISLIKPLQNPYLTLTRFRLSIGSNLSRFSLASLICLCMLTVGVGNVWGAVTALTIPKSWAASGGSSAYTEALGCTKNGLGSDYSASGTKLKFDNTGDYMIIQLASSPAYVSYAILGNSFSGGTFKVQESSNGSTYTDVATYTSSPSGTKTNNLNAATRYIKFVYTTKDKGNIGLGTIVIKARTSVTLDKNGGTADGSAVIAYNATTKESITAPTNAGSTLLGYWEGVSTGNKVLNADGSFAATNVSGWITSSKWTKDAATAKLYARWETSCSNNVTISKGTESNGEITTIATSPIATCSATASERRVTITITPDDCYDAPSNLTWTKSSGTVTASKQSGPTNNGDGTYSYVYQFNQNDNGAGTFGVTCTAKAAGKTVHFDAGPGVSASSSLTETCDGSGITLPNVTASGVCKGWTTFTGWATAAVSDSTTTSVTVYDAGSKYVPASNNMTLYAVYSKSKGSGPSSNVQVMNSGGSLNANWNDDQDRNNGIQSYAGKSAFQMYGETNSSYACELTSQIQFTNITGLSINVAANNANTVSLYYSADGSDWSTWGNTVSVAKNTESYTDYAFNMTGFPSGAYYICLSNSKSSMYMYSVTITSNSSTTYYCSDPNCCTALGTINGSISWTHPNEAVVSWDNIDHVNSWTVKYKTHAAGDYSTWTGEQTVYTKSTTNDSRKVTITGLSPCTNYDFQIIANPAIGYCEKDQTIEDSQTHNWTVTSTGVTNATASPAIPATTCTSGFSTTVTAAAGYDLPSTITVTNASKSWNQATGALTVNSVTGNVSITITPTVHTYTITYKDKGGGAFTGTQTDPPTTHTYGTATTLKIPTKENYSFGGWFTDSDCESGAVGNASSATLGATAFTADITLYAKWVANTHTVTYASNGADGGSVPVDANSPYNHGANVTVLGNTGELTKTHYSFGGWSDGVNTYEEGEDFDISDDVTLSAVWDCAEWVNVSAGTPSHGTFSLSATGSRYTCDGAQVITVTPSANTGYAFSAITQTGLASGVTIDNNAKTVTYAQWANGSSTINVTFAAKSYTVTLDKQSGSGGSGSVLATYDAAMPSATMPTRSGYNFGGYYGSEGGAGTQYYAADGSSAHTWDVADAKTLYAQWTAKNYTITLNNEGADSGKEGTESISVTFNANTNLTSAITKPVKDGYKFGGYYTEEDGSGTQIIDENGNVKASVTSYTSATKQWIYANNIELHAYWKPSYTVTWSVNGETTTEQVVSGEQVAALPTDPTSSDCDDAKVFVGWRSTAIDGVSAANPGSIFTTQAASPAITGDVTFYAVFADENVFSEELTNSEMHTQVCDEQRVYATAKSYTDGDIKYTFNVYNNAADYYWVQMKADDPSAIKIEATKAITQVILIVTAASNSSGGVHDISMHTALAGSTTLSLRTTSRTGTVVASGNGNNVSDNKLTLTISEPSASTLYLTTSAGCRIWGIKVYYTDAPYINYVTSCSSCDADATFTNTTPAVSAIDCDAATLTATDGLATLGADGCNVSDYGFVIGTTDNPTIGGVGVNKLQVGTTNPTIGADFSYDATGLTKGTHYYIRAYATNRHGTAYSGSQNFWTKGVSSIAITTAPTKTKYVEGETFDKTGMVVTATMADGSTEDVTSDCTFSPSLSTKLSDQTAVRATYSLCDVDKTADQAINVYTLTVTEGTNDSYGTAGKTDNKVTVTGLGDHKTYTVTVTSGNADKIDNGDGTYTITNATGNVTVRVDYADAVQVHVYYKVDGVTVTDLTQNVYQSETTTLPSASDLATAMTAQGMDIPDDSYPNFVGWSETEFGAQTSEPTLVTGTPTINAEKTYYAVYTNLNKKQILPSNFSGTYSVNDGDKTYDGVGYFVNNICLQSSMIQFRSNPGYLYSTSALQYIKKIEITGLDLVVNACSDASGTVVGSAITPTGTGTYVYTFPPEKQYFKITGKGGTDKVSLINIYYASATVEYMTQFCTRYDITGVTKSGTAVTGGTLSSNYNSACEGKSVELEAVVSTGYQFNGWTIKKTDDLTQDVTSTLLGANASSLTPPAFSMPDYAITVSASITEKELTGWTWKQALPDDSQIAIPSKVMLYVGQQARFELISYDPSDVLAGKKGYSSTGGYSTDLLAQDNKGSDYYVTRAKAAVESTTLTLTSTSNSSVQEVINIQIKALPSVTFEDHVHSVVFSAVAATIDETDKRVVYLTKTTPTTSDFSGTTYNTCEEQHEHLVGWIESSWADEHPNATHSEIAGAGTGVFYTAGASIDVEAQNGKTFYAVWSKIE